MQRKPSEEDTSTESGELKGTYQQLISIDTDSSGAVSNEPYARYTRVSCSAACLATLPETYPLIFPRKNPQGSKRSLGELEGKIAKASRSGTIAKRSLKELATGEIKDSFDSLHNIDSIPTDEIPAPIPGTSTECQVPYEKLESDSSEGAVCPFRSSIEKSSGTNTGSTPTSEMTFDDIIRQAQTLYDNINKNQHVINLNQQYGFNDFTRFSANVLLSISITHNDLFDRVEELIRLLYRTAEIKEAKKDDENKAKAEAEARANPEMDAKKIEDPVMMRVNIGVMEPITETEIQAEAEAERARSELCNLLEGKMFIINTNVLETIQNGFTLASIEAGMPYVRRLHIHRDFIKSDIGLKASIAAALYFYYGNYASTSEDADSNEVFGP